MDLPYGVADLQPYMSAETLEYHHGKHHAAYINFVNDFVAKETSLAGKTLEEIILIAHGKPEWQPLFNNAAQIYNHNEFWQMLKKHDTIASLPTGIDQHIKSSFGSFDAFKDQFLTAGKTLFGSGWVWLVMNNGKLEIRKYANGGNPLPDHLPGILGCDVWEHSYYIDYRNRRPDYLTAFIDHMVNWEYVDHKLSKI